ncbi:TRAP transporter substrate-binding protein [Billgrantia diversa]|uniref:TRAP transporter substrate-binding protein n=1 Tax=Halomonas sp. MCCC 1A13316 TaxID=2733487 RepID=UPI0018A4E862|nr:TRAP transporter substrate-binding protein [Halomonas sp. MCCC 1A13316]QOR39885.1 TRAP transporter substrate-binding protein [Halomonas sp. MCCC 1A13316]
MKMIKTAFASTALAVAMAPGLGMAQTELQFGHVGNPGSLFSASADEFAKRANERLGDDYQVEVYGSSQLGGDDSMMQKLKLGQLTFTLPSTVMSSVVDEFGLFEMPYLIKDREHMKRVIDEVIEPELYPLVEEEGYKIIAVWENGFRQITNNERPIETPEDLEGLKLRTPKGAWRVRMFEEYGANPSPMALSEVFTALQTGTMDGQENPLVQIHSQKFQEVQDYLSLTGHVYTPAYVVVSKSHWEDLPEDVRDVLEETAQEVQDFVYETAAEQDEQLLGEMEEAGMEINEADKQAFIDASGPVYDLFGEEVEGGSELIERVLELGEEE